MQKPWCWYFSKRGINISYWWNWFRFLVSICKVDKPGWMPLRLTVFRRAQIAVLGISKARARVPFAIFNIIIFFLLSNLFRASQGSPSSRTWYPISFAGHFGEYVWVCSSFFAYDSLIIRTRMRVEFAYSTSARDVSEYLEYTFNSPSCHILRWQQPDRCQACRGRYSISYFSATLSLTWLNFQLDWFLNSEMDSVLRVVSNSRYAGIFE